MARKPRPTGDLFKVEDIQRYGATAIFIAFTAPVVLLFAYVAAGAPTGDPFRGLVAIFAAPGAPTLYLAYVFATVSTVIGSQLLPALKTVRRGKVHLQRAGLFVLGYMGLVVMAGVLLLQLMSVPEFLRRLDGEAPPGGVAQIKTYASWAIGACLTVGATLVGVPPPGPKTEDDATS